MRRQIANRIFSSQTSDGFRGSRVSLLIVVIAALWFAPTLAAETFTVGFDTKKCTHSTIQDAINAIPGNPGDVIRVANDQLYFSDGLLVDSKNLTIEGGYATCDALEPTGKTELIGNFASSVITLINSLSPHDRPLVHLRDLRLRGGGGPFGGGLYVANVDLDGERLEVALNTASVLGGGIYLVVTNARFSDVSVSDNEANTGGGIACATSCNLRLSRGIVFDSNEAVEGGGLYVSGAGAEVVVGAGTLFSNNRGAIGGGLSARTGDVELFGTPDLPVRFEGNKVGTFETTTVGGGAMHAGLRSVVTGSHVQFLDNEVINATNYYECGGAIRVSGGSTVNLWGEGEDTLLIEGNRARWGSAACVRDIDSVLTLHSTVLRANGPDENGNGQALLAVHPGATLLVEGMVMDRNSADDLIQVRGSGTATVAHLSTYLNEAADGSALHSVADLNDYLSEGGTLNFYSSIVWEAVPGSFTPIQTEPLSTLDAECLMISGTPQGLPTMNYLETGSWSNIWQSPQNANFRLHADSPAIDFCDPSVYLPTWYDYDGGHWAVDEIGVINHHFGADIDIGADEYNSADDVPVNGAIFSSDFESGSLEEWGNAVR